MSTPLHVAVDIITTVSKSKKRHTAVDIASLAAEISKRHPDVGYSHEAIAAALTAESLAAGMPVLRSRHKN